MNHRGRFQAQGNNLEESESWAQSDPLYIDQAKVKLTDLKEKIPPVEQKKRLNAFSQCELFMDRASEKGGIEVVERPLRKSFLRNERERVDIEVIKGKAFQKRNEDT